VVDDEVVTEPSSNPLSLLGRRLGRKGDNFIVPPRISMINYSTRE
jgi:hypothetical protein